MQEPIRQVFAVLSAMWQRRWFGVGVSWAVAIVAAVVVLRVPERFEATSRVYVDTQTVLKPLMQGLTVEPDIDQMVAMLARTLITRPKLEELISKSHIDEGMKDARDREALIQNLTHNIKFAPSGAQNLYSIAYRDTDRQRALRVAQELVALFVSSGKGNKAQDTEAARAFIDEQISVYEGKLEEAENRLKEFRLKNVGVLGGSDQDYFSRMASTQQDLAGARVELRAAEESRDALQRQLSGVDPRVDSGPALSATPELDARLDTQRKQLDDLRRRYTDDHPDVIAARRLISQLQEERAREIQALAGKSATSARESNPVYQQIKVRFADAEATVASLRGRVSELSNRLAQLQASAERIPKVEAEMAQLNRDYSVIKHNYEELVKRREEASISGDVDASDRLAEFRVVEPPRLNPAPVFPNRLTMIAIALLLSLAAGVVTCYGMAEARPTVCDARALRKISERPVLGSVSLVDTNGALQAERRYNMMFGLVFAVLIALYGAWGISVFLKPMALP
jgi:polysaccharide chain length determinant protein (PEP-CTERM system associated)